jgi:hypothetical protein
MANWERDTDELCLRVSRIKSDQPFRKTSMNNIMDMNLENMENDNLKHLDTFGYRITCYKSIVIYSFLQEH